MLCAFCFYGHLISICHSGSNHDRLECGDHPLQRPGSCLDGIHPKVWRSGQRFEDVGGITPTGDRGCMSSCSTTVWRPSDGHSSFSDRVGFQAGTSHPTSTSWRSVGGVGGYRSMEYVYGTTYFETIVYSDREHPSEQGEETQNGTSFGSGRRHGVHSGTRKYEEYLVAEAEDHDRRPTTRGRGAHHRTTQCIAEEDRSDGYGTLCRLRCVCPLRIKGSEGKQVQDLRADFRGLHHEGTSRTSELHTMEGLLPSLSDCPPHAGHRRPCSAPQLRDLHGEAGETISDVLALDLCSRRFGEELTFYEDEDVAADGYQGRQTSSQRMGRGETMELSLPSTTLRGRVLEDAGLQPSLDLVGPRRKGQGEDPDGTICSWSPSRWIGGSGQEEEKGVSIQGDGEVKKDNRARREARKRRRLAEREELETLRRQGGQGGKGKGGGGKKGEGKGQSQKCYGWNNGNGPCANLPPGQDCVSRVKREHKCTVCGSPGHPSKDCTKKDAT